MRSMDGFGFAREADLLHEIEPAGTA